jgi:hypothetical protein
MMGEELTAAVGGNMRYLIPLLTLSSALCIQSGPLEAAQFWGCKAFSDAAIPNEIVDGWGSGHTREIAEQRALRDCNRRALPGTLCRRAVCRPGVGSFE